MELNNTTCISETEEINKLIDNINQYTFIIHGITVSVISIIGIVINIFVMAVILANKQLHTRSFILCLQVILVNICNIVIYLPVILTCFYQKWLFGSTGCIVIAVITHIILIWRWFVVLLLILDRLLIVLYPFHYIKYANKIMIILSILSLLLCLSITLISVKTKIVCSSYSELLPTCTLISQCRSVRCFLPNITLTLLVVLCGSIIPIIMYIVMYHKARQIQGGDNSIDTMIQERQCSEHRARCTILILFVCLICLALPSYVTDILVTIFITAPGTLTTAAHIPIYMLYGTHTLIPIADAVVILRNRDIRKAIQKMYCNGNLREAVH